MTVRTTASVGVFAALAYAGSFLLLAVPNATLSLLLVFFAGYILGAAGGLLVGVVSSLLITLFNPYGMPLLPILLAQVIAYGMIGLSGGYFCSRLPPRRTSFYYFLLGLLGLLTALVYQVPVSFADAYLFGPFWERLATSAGFALITVVSNILFFILLFPVLAKFKKLDIFHERQQPQSDKSG